MRCCDVIVQRRRATVLLAAATLEEVNFSILRHSNWLAYRNMEKLEQCLLFQAKYAAIWYFSFMFLANMKRKLLNKAKNTETASTEIDALAHIFSITAINTGPPSLAQHTLVDLLIALLILRVKCILFLFLHIAEKIIEITTFFLLTVAALFWLFEFFDVSNKFGNSLLLP